MNILAPWSPFPLTTPSSSEASVASFLQSCFFLVVVVNSPWEGGMLLLEMAGRKAFLICFCINIGEIER